MSQGALDSGRVIGVANVKAVPTFGKSIRKIVNPIELIRHSLSVRTGIHYVEARFVRAPYCKHVVDSRTYLAHIDAEINVYFGGQFAHVHGKGGMAHYIPAHVYAGVEGRSVQFVHYFQFSLSNGQV